MESPFAGEYRNRLAAKNRSQEADLPGFESKGPHVALENNVLGIKRFGQFALAQRAVVRVLVLPQQASWHE
jgi:hypothetical protein